MQRHCKILISNIVPYRTIYIVIFIAVVIHETPGRVKVRRKNDGRCYILLCWFTENIDISFMTNSWHMYTDDTKWKFYNAIKYSNKELRLRLWNMTAHST